MTFDDAVKEALLRGMFVVIYEKGRMVGSFDPSAPRLIEAHRYQTEQRDYQVSGVSPGESIAFVGARGDGKS